MLRRNLSTSADGKRMAWVVLLCLTLTGMVANAAAALPSAADVVAQLQQKIIEVWRSKADFEQRFQALAPTIVASHDLQTMARFALGSHWQELDSGQREQYLTTFRRLTIATYASRFTHYEGERFVQSGQREL
ncbi:MAG TPA: ABC transporter substrate-binding protein, partial [Nitrococcus sp.]|nr:ABC transporter substrate-binding protein [Nitrococcus sp.]